MNVAAPLSIAIETLKSLLPKPLRRWLRDARLVVRRQLLIVDRLTDFSKLRRVTPYRPDFGWPRGKCVDRYYIESFLHEHAGDIHGRVLEVGESLYTSQFGGSRVQQSDVVDVIATPSATIKADLANATNIPDGVFDCIICTQTLMYVYDFVGAIQTLRRILKPGGVLLATFPGISQIPPASMIGAGQDYWRFTRFSAQRMFSDVFEAANVEVKSYGNVLTATALLHGLVTAELTVGEFEYHDDAYEVIVAIRAVKSCQ